MDDPPVPSAMSPSLAAAAAAASGSKPVAVARPIPRTEQSSDSAACLVSETVYVSNSIVVYYLNNHRFYERNQF